MGCIILFILCTTRGIGHRSSFTQCLWNASWVVSLYSFCAQPVGLSIGVPIHFFPSKVDFWFRYSAPRVRSLRNIGCIPAAVRSLVRVGSSSRFDALAAVYSMHELVWRFYGACPWLGSAALGKTSPHQTDHRSPLTDLDLSGQIYP